MALTRGLPYHEPLRTHRRQEEPDAPTPTTTTRPCLDALDGHRRDLRLLAAEARGRTGVGSAQRLLSVHVAGNLSQATADLLQRVPQARGDKQTLSVQPGNRPLRPKGVIPRRRTITGGPSRLTLSTPPHCSIWRSSERQRVRSMRRSGSISRCSVSNPTTRPHTSTSACCSWAKATRRRPRRSSRPPSGLTPA